MGPDESTTPDRPERARGWLFGLATFLAAALVFAVQPMVARRLLPALGGAPAVWTTCVLFFQAGLVGGYALAHGIARAPRPALQGAAYVGLVAAGLALAGPDPTPADLGRLARSPAPVAGLLAVLAGWVGLPYVALSAASPLLQRWFGGRRRDPYALYAASNAGSLLALAAYPLWIERTFDTAGQLRLWRLGLAGFAALAVLCALAAARGPGHVAASASASLPLGRRARDAAAWAALAFVPSAGLLAVTAHLTTDLAAAPLLWVVPLGLYLVSMIAAFSETGRRALPAAGRILPALLVPTALVLAVGLVQWFWVPLHLLTFVVGAFVVHGVLAERRPGVDRLTAYYLAIAVGGALGGVFCALVAPRLFDRPVEYPIALVAVGLVRAWAGRAGESPGRALAVPGVVGVTAALLASGWGGLADGWAGPPLTMLASGLALLAFATPRARPLRFALTLGAILAAGGFATGVNGRVLHRARNAFGALSVTEAAVPGGLAHRLFHGSTLHGQQDRGPDEARRRAPLTYFTESGPIGDVFDAFRGDGPLRVGVTGVGVGTLAAYARPGDDWAFFEIDPAVIAVARDPAYFSYLADCRADRLRIVRGDARLSLADEPDGAFDLLILDAFSSDAVPVHLLTREAVALYRKKLRPGGRLGFNLSNRYLDLAAAVGSLARDAGWSCLVRVDADVSQAEQDRGKRGSIWAVAAATDADLAPIAGRDGWEAPRARPGAAAWTDERSSLLDYLRPFGTRGAGR